MKGKDLSCKGLKKLKGMTLQSLKSVLQIKGEGPRYWKTYTLQKPSTVCDDSIVCLIIDPLTLLFHCLCHRATVKGNWTLRK